MPAVSKVVLPERVVDFVPAESSGGGGSKGKKPPFIKPPKGGGGGGKNNPNFRHKIWILDD